MPKLNQLKGKENLPKKAVMSCSWPNIPDAKKKGFNDAIDQYNQLEIDGEVEALGEVLFKCTDLSVYTSWDKLYKADKQVFINEAIEIISNLSKFLVVKKGG